MTPRLKAAIENLKHQYCRCIDQRGLAQCHVCDDFDDLIAAYDAEMSDRCVHGTPGKACFECYPKIRQDWNPK